MQTAAQSPFLFVFCLRYKCCADYAVVSCEVLRDFDVLETAGLFDQDGYGFGLVVSDLEDQEAALLQVIDCLGYDLP